MADIVDFNKAIDEIKLKVTIPKYFEEIIATELNIIILICKMISM